MKITIEINIEDHGDPLLKGPDPLKKVMPEKEEQDYYCRLADNFFDKFLDKNKKAAQDCPYHGHWLKDR